MSCLHRYVNLTKFSNFLPLLQDGWVDKFDYGRKFYEAKPEQNELSFLIWLVVFVFMVIIFGFVISSLFVASVVTNLDKAMLEQSEGEKKEEQNEDFLSGVFDKEEYDEVNKEDVKRDLQSREIKLEYLTDFSIFGTTKHKVEKQVLHKCSSGKRTSERVEDKLLLLGKLL